MCRAATESDVFLDPCLDEGGAFREEHLARLEQAGDTGDSACLGAFWLGGGWAGPFAYEFLDQRLPRASVLDIDCPWLVLGGLVEDGTSQVGVFDALAPDVYEVEEAAVGRPLTTE